MKPITLTRAAAKALAHLPASTQADLTAKPQRYSETGAGDVRSLVGRAGSRLRVGDDRVMFEETEREIVVVSVGHRRDIYR